MTARIARTICLGLSIGVLLSGCRKQSTPPQVTIKEQTWAVELALTDRQRYEGLSGRTHVAETAGMLFVHPEPMAVEYCMRGCLIPLDIAFITPDMRVATIYTMAVEDDLVGRVRYPSRVPVQYVLEVSGGALGRAGVEVGDKVMFSGDIPRPAKADSDQ